MPSASATSPTRALSERAAFRADRVLPRAGHARLRRAGPGLRVLHPPLRQDRPLRLPERVLARHRGPHPRRFQHPRRAHRGHRLHPPQIAG
ncbi:MAG: hypothetical protein MZV70_35540 [Desulfobacterales bacterium]|nr:hypothetical protein [Desulfobacterales bacterium]